MILVTGAGGFIGRAIAAALGPAALPTSHRASALPTTNVDITAVVHAGRDPRFGQPDYRSDDDAELAIARFAAARDLPFVTLGTRKVYAPAEGPLAEEAPLGPSDHYGAQKLALEQALDAILGPRLTRLRLANIFGHERGRKSFLGMMIDRLETTDTINFDMSPFVQRDFLPVETAAAAIAKLTGDPPGGIVNIGSGIPLEVGRLALALIEGRGRGRLLVTDPRHHDAFTLEVGRMRELTGIATDRDAILATAAAVGSALERKAD